MLRKRNDYRRLPGTQREECYLPLIRIQRIPINESTLIHRRNCGDIADGLVAECSPSPSVDFSTSCRTTSSPTNPSVGDAQWWAERRRGLGRVSWPATGVISNYPTVGAGHRMRAMKTILSQAAGAVLAAIVVLAAGYIWKNIQSGGLVKAMGGATGDEIARIEQSVGILEKVATSNAAGIEYLGAKKQVCDALVTEEYQPQPVCPADMYQLMAWCSGDCNADDVRVTVCCNQTPLEETEWDG